MVWRCDGDTLTDVIKTPAIMPTKAIAKPQLQAIRVRVGMVFWPATTNKQMIVAVANMLINVAMSE